MIDFFSNEDLKALLDMIGSDTVRDPNESLKRHEASLGESSPLVQENAPEDTKLVDDRAPEEVKKDEDEEIYSVKNFSI